MALTNKPKLIPLGEKDENFTVTIYPDNRGKHRWNIKSDYNGDIIGASSQGFASKEGAKRNLKLLGKDIEQYLKDI